MGRSNKVSNVVCINSLGEQHWINSVTTDTVQLPLGKNKRRKVTFHRTKTAIPDPRTGLLYAVFLEQDKSGFYL